MKEYTSSIQVEPSTSQQGETRANGEAPPIDENEEVDQHDDQQHSQDDKIYGDDEDESQPTREQFPILEAQAKKDHPTNQILKEIKQGRITRSKLKMANFCEHYSFVFLVEQIRIEEALEDMIGSM